MVEEEYWQEKRVELKHVLSAWVLVLVLLAGGLALAGLAGGTSCDRLAVLDDRFASERCVRQSTTREAAADRRSR